MSRKRGLVTESVFASRINVGDVIVTSYTERERYYTQTSLVTKIERGFRKQYIFRTDSFPVLFSPRQRVTRVICEKDSTIPKRKRT